MAKLSTQLVQQWLMIVKGTAGQIQQQVQAQNQNQIQAQSHPQNETEFVQTVTTKTDNDASNESNKPENGHKDGIKIEIVNEDATQAISTGTFYKTTGKDGKLVIRKLSQDSSKKDDADDVPVDTEKSEEKREVKEKGKIQVNFSKGSNNKTRMREKDEKKSDKVTDRERDKEREKDRKKSSSTNSKNSNKSSANKYKVSSSGKSREDKDRHRDKGKDREKDRERDKHKDNDKDRHRGNGSLKTSSSSSRSSKDKKEHRDRDKEREKERVKHAEKDKQSEKDNNTLENLKPPTIDKLGRIPKKAQPEDEKLKDNVTEIKKKGFSVGIRKDKENDERPKTVKIFNSKMRSTGLEEEVKPAPPRSATTSKKPTPSVQLPVIPQKRPSPPKDVRESIVPPEKKLKMDKIDAPERPGAIKLIPPKPKRKFFRNTLFMIYLFLQVPAESRRMFPRTLQHLAGACWTPFC